MVCPEDGLGPGDKINFPSPQDLVSTSLYLAQLPLRWIQHVLAADCLAINCEFDRYCLTKTIFEIRQARIIPDYTNVIVEEFQSAAMIPAMLPKPESPKKAVSVANTIYRLIDRVISGTAKKRKLDEEYFAPFPQNNVKEIAPEVAVSQDRVILPLPVLSPKLRFATSSVPTLPSTLANIYEKGIIYTYMTFSQLGYFILFYIRVVKKDEIVPFHLALESYWLQTELGSREALNHSENSNKLPPLRFSSKFENINEFFRKSPKPAVMVSDPVNCAGTIVFNSRCPV